MPGQVTWFARRKRNKRRFAASFAGRRYDHLPTLTRARQRAYIVGDIQAANAAIHNVRAVEHRTGLVEKLAFHVAGIKLTVKERVA